MQVAFGLVAEQGAATRPKHQLSADELVQRDVVGMREVQLTQSYRWERTQLAMSIAEGVHCRFVWIGSLTQEEPTHGYFVGCSAHVDRARLLFELIDPDLRLLTRFIGPRQGAGSGPGGAPSADGRDFYASRSAAMIDVVNWIHERLYETEVLAASRNELAEDFAEDRDLADEFVDDMWGDTVNVYGLGAGQPDYPIVDGLPAQRFREFMRELGEEGDEGADADLEGDFEQDPDADPDDDFDYSFDLLDEDEDEEGDEAEPEDDGTLALFSVGADGGDGDDGCDAVEGESSGPSRIADVTWVYFIEGGAGDDVDPCLIRFGAAGWQLYYPAMGEWFGDPVLEEMALDTGLFRSVTRFEAENWVHKLAKRLAGSGGFAPRRVIDEVRRCIDEGLDEQAARHAVRVKWGNLPDALLAE